METIEMKWMVKCEDCRIEIKRTNSIQESNQGGTCELCKDKQIKIAEGKTK